MGKPFYRYEIVRLIDGHKIDEMIKPVAPEHQDDLEVLSVIVDTQRQRLVRYNGSIQGREIDDEIIFLHQGINLIGTYLFQMDTQLTPKATDAEIDAELRRYAESRYRLTSVVLYPDLEKIIIFNGELVRLIKGDYS